MLRRVRLWQQTIINNQLRPPCSRIVKPLGNVGASTYLTEGREMTTQKPSFIYPQWMTAKRKLIEKLKLTPQQTVILNAWFARNIFEFGQDYTISREVLEQSNIPQTDLLDESRYVMARRLLENILSKGMFLEQITDTWLGKNIRMTILIAGSPLLVGPEEGGER